MSHRSDKLSGLTWHAIGLASGLGLYFLESYFAFFEGCLLSLYTASLWPHISRRLTHYPPGQALSVAILTWCTLCVASVWIVAYNFVPGGSLTRERTDVLIVVVVFLVALASRDHDSGGEVGNGVKGEVREGGGEVVRVGGEREGLRKRVVNKLPPISEEEEEEGEGEGGEGEGEGEGGDFEVDSTGSSVHEERAMELLATEEKESLRFRHRANRGTHTHTRQYFCVSHYTVHFAFCIREFLHFTATVAVAILLFSLLGYAYRYHPTPPTHQTVRPLHPLHHKLHTHTLPIISIDCRSTPPCSVQGYGPFTLGMTTMPGQVWRGQLSFSMTQVTMLTLYTSLPISVCANVSLFIYVCTVLMECCCVCVCVCHCI